MTRLLGYFANQADRLPCALEAESAALSLDRPMRCDGWGVGTYQGGEPLLRRKPSDPREEIHLLDLVRGLRTSCAVVHVRSATVGPRSIDNTHPFRHRQWLFAHHGTLPDFATRRQDLLAGIPDFLIRSIRGDTDSEVLFYRFLAAVHETGRLDDPEFDRSAILTALRETVVGLDQTLGVASATLNLVVTNSHSMVALRRGAPMAWVRRHGLRDCPVCRRPSDTPGRPPRALHHDALRYVLVASPDAPSTPGWESVAEGPLGACVAIDRQLNVQTVSL